MLKQRRFGRHIGYMYSQVSTSRLCYNKTTVIGKRTTVTAVQLGTIAIAGKQQTDESCTESAAVSDTNLVPTNTCTSHSDSTHNHSSGAVTAP